MDKWIVYSLLVINLICLSSATLDITDLKVPKSVSLSENTDVILDCIYEVTDKQGLVIKWFLDKDEQVYQWIPATRKPQAMGRLKDRLDLEYKASNDLYTMHRALKIKKVTKELTGIYSCKVSSFENEDVESKKMVVYQPATDIELTHDEDENTLACNAEGVYPKPRMNIYVKNQDNDDDDNDDDDDDDNDNENIDSKAKKDDDDEDDDDKKKKKRRRTTKRADKDGDGKDDDEDDDNDDDDDNDNDNNNSKNKSNNDNDDDDEDDDDDVKDANSNEDEDHIELEKDGTYNITSLYKYEEDSLTEPVVFICELYIPDTDYKILEKISYVPENGAMAKSPVSLLVTIFAVAFTIRDLLF